MRYINLSFTYFTYLLTYSSTSSRRQPKSVVADTQIASARSAELLGYSLRLPCPMLHVDENFGIFNNISAIIRTCNSYIADSYTRPGICWVGQI